MRYRTIVADPPWTIGRGPEWASNGASRLLTYDTMTLDDIASLPVSDLAERGAHLYVWTINAYVEDTYEIVRAWGFRPSTLLTWCKPPNGIGLGGSYSLTTEHVLFARRGALRAKERIDSTWWAWPRRHHSAKPEAFLDMVERVSPGPLRRAVRSPRKVRLGLPDRRPSPRRSGSVRRSSPLARKSPLARRQPLRSRRRPVEMTAERAAWKDTGAGYCQCCGRYDMLEGHHVVAAQTIRAEGKLGMLWDLRNRMLVARHCHEQHTSAFQRFHVDRIPDSALEFAREFWGDDLRAALYIARTYRGEL